MNKLAMLIACILFVSIGTQIEQANDLRERLLPATQEKVERLGYGAHLWRRYGLQMELLREHLEWLHIGLSDRQIMVVQVCVLGRLLERAQEAIDQPTDEEQKKYRTQISMHRELGYILLKKKLEELGDVEDSELRFRLLW